MVKKIIAVVIVLLILGFYFGRNYLVKAAVEESGNYALGTETSLGSANLSLTGGSLELNDYVIPNPDGFSDKKFFTLKSAYIQVDNGSLMGDEVVIESLVIDGIHMNIEQIDTKGNYLSYFQHLKSLNLTSSEESEQNIKIKHTAVRNISLETSISIMGQNAAKGSAKLENFTLENLGGDKGASATKLMTDIFKAIFSKTSTKVSNLPNIDPAKLKEDAKEKLNEEVDKAKEDAENKLKNLLD